MIGARNRPGVCVYGRMLNTVAPCRGRDNHNGEKQTHILVGVTSAQTCILLADRLKALSTEGFRVSVLSAPGNMLEDALSEGVDAYTFPMKRRFSPFVDLLSFVRMLCLFWRLRPQIVELSTPKLGLLGSVVAWICRVPIRIYLLRGLKLETSRGFKRQFLLAMERLAARCAHLVVCNSPSLKKRAEVLGVAEPSKLVILGDGSSNGVDLRRFSPGESDIREQFGIPEDAPVIGFVGRLTGDKGLPELLEAFAMILREEPNAYLLLVGWFDAAEDGLELAIRERVEGHPRIVCTGYVPDTAPYYRAMDLMILPSWREGLPNAILEAAASEVPVIATKCTGSRDAVVPDVTGLLVPCGYPGAFCEAMLHLIRNPQRRREMGSAARKWVAERYSSERVLGLTVQFYDDLVDSKGPMPTNF